MTTQKKNQKIVSIYQSLLNLYGSQGWWPLVTKSKLDGFDSRGYHKNLYESPDTSAARFEIFIGAILTQNTAWTQVEKAILNLQSINALTAEKILDLSFQELSQRIQPAGYFNQKSKYLKNLAAFYLELNGETPQRNELLNVTGVGFETADSILLYAYHIPVFVIDAYTKRLCSYYGLCKEKPQYHELQALFEDSLEKNPRIYQEYHALIVEHCKYFFSKQPRGDDFRLLSSKIEGN